MAKCSASFSLRCCSYFIMLNAPPHLLNGSPTSPKLFCTFIIRRNSQHLSVREDHEKRHIHRYIGFYKRFLSAEIFLSALIERAVRTAHTETISERIYAFKYIRIEKYIFKTETLCGKALRLPVGSFGGSIFGSGVCKWKNYFSYRRALNYGLCGKWWQVCRDR